MATGGSVGGDLTGGLTAELRGLVELLVEAKVAMAEFGNTGVNLEKTTAEVVALQRQMAELKIQITELSSASPKTAQATNTLLASKGVTDFSVTAKEQGEAEVAAVEETAATVRSVRLSAANQAKADLKVATQERITAIKVGAEQETAEIKANLDEQRAAYRAAAQVQISEARAVAAERAAAAKNSTYESAALNKGLGAELVGTARVNTAQGVANVNTDAKAKQAAITSELIEQRTISKIIADDKITENNITEAQVRSEIRLTEWTQKRAAAEAQAAAKQAESAASKPNTIGGNLVSGFTRDPNDPLAGVTKTIGRFMDYALIGGLAYGLTTAFSDGAKDIIQYQDALANLQIALGGFNGTVDTTSSSLAGMMDQLMQVSKYTGDNVSTTVEIAAKGIAAFGKPGSAMDNADNQKIGVDYATATTQLATITGETQQNNAGDLTAIAGAYGLNSAQFQQVNDAIAKARLMTGADPGQLTQGLSMIATTAAQDHIQLNQAAIMMGRLTTNLNESGQTAATRAAAITQMLTGSTGRSAIAQVNQMVGKDYQVNTQADTGTQMLQLSHALTQLSPADQQTVRSKIGGTRQGREFDIIMQYADQIFGTDSHDAGGAGQSQFDTLTGNIKSTLTQIRSELQNLIVNFSKTHVFDTIGAALTAINPALDAMNSMLEIYNKIPFSGWLTNLALLGVAYNVVSKAMQRNAIAIAEHAAAQKAGTAATEIDAAVQKADAAAIGTNTVSTEANMAAKRLTTTQNLQRILLNPATGGNMINGVRSTGAGLVSGVTNRAYMWGVGSTGVGAANSTGEVMQVGSRLNNSVGAGLADSERVALANGSKMAAGFKGFMTSGLGITLWATAGITIASELIKHAGALAAALSDSENMATQQVNSGDAQDYQKQATALEDQSQKLHDASSGFWGTIVSWGSDAKQQQQILDDEAKRFTDVAKALQDARSAAQSGSDTPGNAIDITSADSVTSSLQALNDSGASATTQIDELVAALEKLGPQAQNAAYSIGAKPMQDAVGTMVASGFQNEIGGMKSQWSSNVDSQNKLGFFDGLSLGFNGLVGQGPDTGMKDQNQGYLDSLKGIDLNTAATRASGVLTDYLANNGGKFNPNDLKKITDDQDKALESVIGPDKWKTLPPLVQQSLKASIAEQDRKALTNVLGYDPFDQETKDGIKNYVAGNVATVLALVHGIQGLSSQAASEAVASGALSNDPRGSALIQAQTKYADDSKAVTLGRSALMGSDFVAGLAQAQVNTAQATVANAKPGADMDKAKQDLADAQDALKSVQSNMASSQKELDSAQKAVDQDQVNLIAATSQHLTALSNLAGSLIHDNTLSTLSNQIADQQRILATPGLEGDAKIQAQTQLNSLNTQYAQAARQAKEQSLNLGVNPGDSSALAKVAVQQAKDQIAFLQGNGNAWNSPEMITARLDLQSKQYAYNQSLVAQANAQDKARVFPGSSLQAAAEQITEAQRALNIADKGSTEWWAAYGQMQQMQQQYAEAQLQAASNSNLLGLDLTNSVQTSQEQLRLLQSQYAQLASAGAPKDVLDAKQLEIKKQQTASDQAAFQQQLSAMQTQDSLGQISHDSYMNWVTSERDRIVQRLAGMNDLDNGYQQLVTERNQMDQILHDAAKSFTGQFNLGDVKLPSVYQAREALGLPGSGVGSSYNDNRTVTITVNGGDLAAVQSVIRDAVGAPAQSLFGTTVGKV